MSDREPEVQLLLVDEVGAPAAGSRPRSDD